DLAWSASVPARPSVIGVLIVINREHWNEDVEMRSVLDVASRWVLCGLGDRLTNWRLHLVRIGLRLPAIEIQIHGGLINTVKVLQIGKRNEPAIAEAIGLVGSELRICAVRKNGRKGTDGERQPKPTQQCNWESQIP